QNYIAENSTDFIRFKAKILLEEAQDNPIKKAELIRDIIHSISLIPNIIQRELYIQEAAKIMDVREEVLFKELGQNLHRKQKENREKKQSETTTNTMEVGKEKRKAVNTREIVQKEEEQSRHRMLT